jgi:DNA primase
MDAPSEIKARLDVDEVIGSYIQLKPAGANLRGVCPFHQEKTASFMVSPEKGIWHCFGCGEGGDIFTFVEKMEGLDFRGALEKLAARAGVTLENRQSKPGEIKRTQRLYQILELATRYYQAQLVKSKTAQNYLKGRKFSAETIKTWRFGWAPTKGDELVKFLRSRQISDAEIVAAGLARKQPRGLVDMFRGRVLLPLADVEARVIGYTGRVLDDKALPKYLNTPQTKLFDKSRFLFGLHLAREAIKQSDMAVVVEGNMDVVASHQAGIAQVVASSGTALTAPQLKLLSRFTRTVKLAFDQDSAGLRATERAIPLAQAAGVSLHIVNLGQVKDPDELINLEGGKQQWHQAIAKAPYVMDWLLETLPKQYKQDSATAKKQLSDHFIAVLNRLSDPIEQDHYAQKLAELIDVSPQSVRAKLAQQPESKAAPPEVVKAAFQARPVLDESRIAEEALLGLTLLFSDTRVSLQDLSADNWSTEERQDIHRYIQNHPTTDFKSQLPTELQKHDNYVKILLLQGEERYGDWAPLDRRIESFSLAQRLANLKIKKQQKELNAEIRQAEASGDKALKQKLLRQFRDLSRKI